MSDILAGRKCQQDDCDKAATVHVIFPPKAYMDKEVGEGVIESSVHANLCSDHASEFRGTSAGMTEVEGECGPHCPSHNA